MSAYKNKYRVFVTRHYISVRFFDIEADIPNDARKAAVKAAYKVEKDSRDIATDNGWHAEDPVSIEELGYSSAPFEVVQVLETKKAIVYEQKET
jgi:hypothetical protein